MSKVFSKIKSIFRKSDLDTFTGLIDENGVVKGASEDNWSMTFCFIAYFKNNGRIVEDEVVIHRDIPSADYGINGLDPLTIVKLTGEQISYHGQNRINLSSIVQTNLSHHGLSKIRDNRLQPITYSSFKFGTFTLDRRSHWFETKTSWNESEIELFLSTDLSEIENAEKLAIEIWNDSTNWDLRFNSKISDELLKLKNQHWLDDEEPPISKEAFLSQIRLESIVVHLDGYFEAWFNDGNLFWGHAINVSASVDGSISDCGIHG